ncbi:MAG TPA: hypothetical protein EYQ53_06675 [Candidatus Poseidoniales archaeon]|jgi:MtN3 and saliva related transmembrane protein|nr:MAG: hypothetical protein CXT69_03165 [Euryarchaeota archaeon]HIG04044.1 hypothetical protein [Candidatus Poseidoniales archaeon]HIK79095.1 hypothetical protein [Candidatus Poseidoniales archaeon]
MAEMMIEFLGLFAGAIGVVAWIPQIKEVWVHKRHEGISLPTFFIVALSLSLWLIYGILLDSLAMLIANILTLSILSTVIYGVIKLRRTDPILEK